MDGMNATMEDRPDRNLGGFSALREDFFWSVWFFLFLLLCLSASASYSADVEEKLWSFKFKECSVSEALVQISRASGIKITTNVPVNTKVPKKSFKNKKIGQVLKNLLRGKSYAMVWNQDHKGARFIHISIIDHADKKRGGEGLKAIRQPVSVIHLGGSKDARAKAN